MICLIGWGKGIISFVKDFLSKLPARERYNMVPEDDISSNNRLGFIPKYSSYIKIADDSTEIIDLFGPYVEVPKFLIYSSQDEEKVLKNEPKDGYEHTIKQWHILVYDDAIFFNEIFACYYGAARIRTEATIFLKGAHICHSGELLSFGLEHMIKISTGPKKIIYSSDFCLKILIETLDRLGYSQMQE